MKLTELQSTDFYTFLTEEAEIITNSNTNVDQTKAVTLIKALYECMAETK